jgi:hypothetical protein
MATLLRERASLLRRLDATGWQWDARLSHQLEVADAALENMEGQIGRTE